MAVLATVRATLTQKIPGVASPAGSGSQPASGIVTLVFQQKYVAGKDAQDSVGVIELTVDGTIADTFTVGSDYDFPVTTV